MSDTKDKTLVSISQAAELLDIPITHVLNMLEWKAMPFEVSGGMRLIRRDLVIAEKRRRDAVSEKESAEQADDEDLT